MASMAHSSPLIILVDNREAMSPVPQALRQLTGVEVKFAQLAVGDYEVERRCVFERKTLVDFADSIADGRVFVQAQKLAKLKEPAALILEGQGGAATGVRRESLQGAMISLSLIFHLPVLRAADPVETARLLIYAGQQLRRREWDAGCRQGKRPKRKRRLQLHILQGLPGVGPTRAEQLLRAFGSVQAVMTADLEHLVQIEGLGAKRATAIREILEAKTTAPI